MSQIHNTTLMLMTGLLVVGATSAIAAPSMQSGNQTISYIQGGIGSDQEQALKAESGKFNLHVTSTERGAGYTTDDSLTVRDGRGHVLISANNVDPLFYAKLPAGRYTIAATNDGQREVRKISVSDTKPANVYLTW